MQKWSSKLGPVSKQILDQALHIAWGCGSTLLAAGLGASSIACAVTAIIIFLPREFIDQWPIRSWVGKIVDLGFFGIGGALSPLFVKLL